MGAVLEWTASVFSKKERTMANFFTKLLSFGADRQLKEFYSQVNIVNYLEDEMKTLSDEELRAKTDEFRQRYDNGETLDELMPEAFAVVREASVRVTGMRHFDVQLIGGMVLNKGQIAEMRTGEGKTLVSTLAVYLNAIPGKGVHVVTVNDYLAKRDSEWMGRIYKFLGLTVGLLQNGTPAPERKLAYQADVTYGTNTEFGFDYLRDNMVTSADKRVQRGHNFCIIDEVDSILIDEARTPLIISGQASKANDQYISFAKAVRGLKAKEDFDIDEAKRTISANEQGLAKVESRLHIDDIYADLSGQLSNHLHQALKAEYLFKKGVDYIVVDGEVKIVDEFTGRIMEGRRYSEGLHQAIEAKEGVLIRAENQTMATITLQNYFRLYKKLAGMTGTAKTEDAEFRDIYKLEVQVVPPNRPVMREDLPDLVYRTVEAKFNAVVEDVLERHERQQPCLVGTVSIENSEKLSALFKKRGIPHEVLNAKQHEREAKIVAQAGRAGAVTIATNMAGRGTDILLGGNPDFLAEDILLEKGIDPEEATEAQRADALEQAKAICDQEAEVVKKAGGLAVIGTERHESRRIDNQLRGRSARQGDPGSAQFYLSLEDDLMRLFGGDRMDRIGAMMLKTELGDDMPIQAKMVTKGIEGAQRQVESMHASARKHVLEYDDVMNRQRSAIYEERNSILDGKDYGEHVASVIEQVVTERIAEYCTSKAADEWELDSLQTWLDELIGPGAVVVADLNYNEDVQQLTEQLVAKVNEIYSSKKENMPEDVFAKAENFVMLRVIDTRWMAHLSEMDYLKAGIGLRAVGQRDPLVEYKEEAFNAFGLLVNNIYEDYLRTMFHLQINVEVREEDNESEAEKQVMGDNAKGSRNSVFYSAASQDEAAMAAMARAKAKNDALKAQRALKEDKLAKATDSVAGGKLEESSQKGTTFVKDKDDPFANAGRNDPCPCGSGKKFKNCCGKNN